MLKQGEHVFFAFQDGKAVLDSQNRPRMYKSRKQFEKCYPGFRLERADLVEYAPVMPLPEQKENRPGLNCTPIVRQYGILNNEWGVFQCQKESQTKGTQQSLNKKWWKRCGKKA